MPKGAAGTPEPARRLGTGDTVVLGLGAMLGAGVFAAWGPAASAGLLIGLALAAAVALWPGCSGVSHSRWRCHRAQ